LAPDVPAGLLNAVVHGAASAGFDGVDLLLARGGGTVALPVRFPRICGPSDAPGPEKECVSLMLVVGDTTATLTAEPTTSDPTSCMSVERRRIVPVRDRSPIVRTLGGGAAAQPSPTAPATPPGKTCHAMPHAGGKLDRAALEARVREAKGTTSCVGAAAGATPAVLWSDLAPALEALVVSAGAASLTLAVPEATTPQCPTSK
jgi:hypothetical protein